MQKLLVTFCYKYIYNCERFSMSTAISRWKYRFSSDHRSQATSRVVSTWMGDRLGTPLAVDNFFLSFFFFRFSPGLCVAYLFFGIGRAEFPSYCSFVVGFFLFFLICFIFPSLSLFPRFFLFLFLIFNTYTVPFSK